MLVILLVNLNPELKPNATEITDSTIKLAAFLVFGIAGEDVANLLRSKPESSETAAAVILTEVFRAIKPESTLVITPEMVREFFDYVIAKQPTNT
jgi:hypothetical protein